MNFYMKLRTKNIWVFIGLSLMALLIALGLSLWQGEKLTQQGGFLESYKLPLTLLRLGLIAVLVGGWPYLVRYFSTRNQWDEMRMDYMLRLRWKVAFLLIAIELIVIEDWMGNIF